MCLASAANHMYLETGLMLDVIYVSCELLLAIILN